LNQSVALVDIETDIQQGFSNAEYPIKITPCGKATLVDGVQEKQAAPGSAKKVKASLSDI
jgi:hypothetical protein